MKFIIVPTKTPGTGDIVGFSNSGVVILRNSVNIQSLAVIANFGYDIGGWRVEKHVRLLGDTTGNRAADVIGFGERGVWISVNNGNNSFQAPKMVLNDLSYANGWRVEKHIRFVADIRKAGRVDIVGFGDDGIYISLNNGGGAFGPAHLTLNDFGYNQGWRIEKHLRFLADVTGDGLLDVVGFGEKHVFIGLNNGDGTFQPAKPVLNDLCIGAGGWQLDKHPRVVADLTGNGRADLLGFGESGVWVSFNNGIGLFGPPTMVVDNFGYTQGWRIDRHPRFVADLTGKKYGDIIGFADDGVYVSYNNGNGTFQPPKLVVKDFGYNNTWRVEKHPRFVVDLTGDGCADIIGFGDTAVYVSYNDGKGNFGPVHPIINAFGYNNGEWALDKTVRYIANLYV